MTLKVAMLRNNKKRAHIAAHDRATFQNTEKYDCLTEKVLKYTHFHRKAFEKRLLFVER